MSCVVVAVVVAPYDWWAGQPLGQVGAFASHAEKVGVALLRAEQGTSAEKKGRTVWVDCGLRRVVSPARRGGAERAETLQLCETSQVHQADH